jgi:ribonuclease HII
MLEPVLWPGRLEAGIDEAGRGCYAGPVCAAAVVLPAHFFHPLLNDSKKLTEAGRQLLRPIVEAEALAWAVGWASVEEIDRLNILQASFLAMHRAIVALRPQPQFLLIDGNRFAPYHGIGHACVVGGDGRYTSIAAASILAKTHRDALVQTLHAEYPQYGWNKNKTYGTAAHRAAIAQHGLCPHHRKSFKI